MSRFNWGYRKAVRFYRIREWMNRIISAVFIWGTNAIYGENGFKYHGPTHLIADIFYRDLEEDDGYVCPVCAFWRGIIVGCAVSMILFGIVIFLFKVM